MRLFEILDKLNLADVENKTANLIICPDVIAIDKKGNNGEVKIGIPGSLAQELVLNDCEGKSLMLIVVDLKEYNKIKDA